MTRMVTEDDVIDAFYFMRGANLKGVPTEEEAVYWVRVLRDVDSELFQAAVDHYLRTPRQDKSGNMQGAYWCPSSCELRRIAFELEGNTRHKIRETKRGCARCGELLNEEGAIVEHGSGYRIVIQHCHPVDEDGIVRWELPPRRVGQRRVLCDCNKGRLISIQQRSVEKAPQHASGWSPTLTLEEAEQRFQRADARLYITGSDSRKHHHDLRSVSPFYTRPSPEELCMENPAKVRSIAYGVVRGEINPSQHIKRRLIQMARQKHRRTA